MNYSPYKILPEESSSATFESTSNIIPLFTNVPINSNSSETFCSQQNSQDKALFPLSYYSPSMIQDTALESHYISSFELNTTISWPGVIHKFKQYVTATMEEFYVPSTETNSLQNKTTIASFFDALQPYELRGAADVGRFVCCHFELLPLLKKIPNQVKSNFGENTQLALRTVTDPEDTKHISLIVLIKSKKEVAETINCLDKLDNSWWLEASQSVSDLISINTEYV